MAWARAVRQWDSVAMLAGSIAADEGRHPAEIDSQVWGMSSPQPRPRQPCGRSPSRSRSPLGRHITLETRSPESCSRLALALSTPSSRGPAATSADQRVEQRGQQLRFGMWTFLIAAGVPVMEVYAAMCELPNFLFRSWARRHPQEPNSVLILDLDACISDRAPQRWARFHERAMHMDRLVRQRTWAWQAAHALKHRLAAEGVRLASCILSFVVAPITLPPALPSQCRHCRVEFDSCVEVVRHWLSATAH